MPEPVLARLGRGEVGAQRRLPHPPLTAYAADFVSPVLLSFGVVPWAMLALAVSIAARVVILRRRLHEAGIDAVHLGGNAETYIRGLARTAWIHRRSLERVNPLAALLGIRPPRERMEAAAKAFGPDGGAVESAIAAAQEPAADRYPFAAQVV